MKRVVSANSVRRQAPIASVTKSKVINDFHSIHGLLQQALKTRQGLLRTKIDGHRALLVVLFEGARVVVVCVTGKDREEGILEGVSTARV